MHIGKYINRVFDLVPNHSDDESREEDDYSKEDDDDDEEDEEDEDEGDDDSDSKTDINCSHYYGHESLRYNVMNSPHYNDPVAMAIAAGVSPSRANIMAYAAKALGADTVWAGLAAAKRRQMQRTSENGSMFVGDSVSSDLTQNYKVNNDIDSEDEQQNVTSDINPKHSNTNLDIPPDVVQPDVLHSNGNYGQDNNNDQIMNNIQSNSGVSSSIPHVIEFSEFKETSTQA